MVFEKSAPILNMKKVKQTMNAFETTLTSWFTFIVYKFLVYCSCWGRKFSIYDNKIDSQKKRTHAKKKTTFNENLEKFMCFMTHFVLSRTLLSST